MRPNRIRWFGYIQFPILNCEITPIITNAKIIVNFSHSMGQSYLESTCNDGIYIVFLFYLSLH